MQLSRAEEPVDTHWTAAVVGLINSVKNRAKYAETISYNAAFLPRK